MVAMDIYKVPGKPRSISALEVCEYKVRAACLDKWGILAGPVILLKWISKGSLWHFLLCMFFHIWLCQYGILSKIRASQYSWTLQRCYAMLSLHTNQWDRTPTMADGALVPSLCFHLSNSTFLGSILNSLLIVSEKKESFNLQAFMEGNLKVSLPNNFILVMRK